MLSRQIVIIRLVMAMQRTAQFFACFCMYYVEHYGKGSAGHNIYAFVAREAIK